MKKKSIMLATLFATIVVVLAIFASTNQEENSNTHFSSNVESLSLPGEIPMGVYTPDESPCKGNPYKVRRTCKRPGNDGCTESDCFF